MISIKGVTKRFPGVLANDHVSLDVREGEIHAVIGENGAGKSTLMKILYGLYQPDDGVIELRGRPVRIDGPARAVALGIGMVHQHFMLIPRFSVLENIILGHEMARCGVLDRHASERRVRELAEQYGFAIDPRATVSTLSVGQQQRVEILKVLYRGADVLILDEPTAVLAPQEVAELFANLRLLASGGKTIIFIGHKLDEVMEVADRVTVLRRGQVVGTMATAETSRERLAEMMVGRPVLFRIQKNPSRPGEPLLSLDAVTVRGGQGGAHGQGQSPGLGRAAVDELSLQVNGGEIYGVAGVEGNGQTELVEGIFNLQPVAGGRVMVMGKDVTNRPTAQVRAGGIAYIPEDRHRRGLVLPMSIWENIILGSHRRRQFLSGALLDRERILGHASELREQYDIRLADMDAPVLALSGGNQQKVIVARELAQSPQVVIASQPTRGLDVGAAEFVRQRLLEMRDAGRAVLLISADLEEVLSLSDRVGVMFRGKIVAEFSAEEATPQVLGPYMLGGAAPPPPGGAGTAGADTGAVGAAGEGSGTLD